MTDCAVEPLYPDPAEGRAAAVRRRLALVLVASGMFMAVLDTTIVNVALPSMRAHLHASVSGLAWIVDAYTLSFAALILAGGVASDRFGAKSIYLAGLALFVAASAACGLAPSVGTLVAARFAQGMGAALFLPASLAIVRATFDDPAERARAIAAWAGIASIAAAIGPVAGGLLVDGFGWRSAFLVNVPTGIVALAGAWIVVRADGRAARSSGFDAKGQIASTIALAALCFTAIELPTRGMASPEVWGAMAVTIVASALLIAVERRAAHPMVPLAWFRNAKFVAMNASGTLVYIGYFSVLFLLSLYLHGVRGLDARQTGLAMLPMAASLSLGNVLAGKLQGRLSATRMMTIGLVTATLAGPAMAALLETNAPWAFVIVAMAGFGAGTALSVPPMISTILEQVPGESAGVASGLLNALRQAGSLLGVAFAGAAAVLAVHLSTALTVVGVLAGVTYAGAACLAAAAGRARGYSAGERAAVR
ncbi:MFS transporter [Trinickia dabaoshanensis]|uniref:MFS transporter n=1 Tax=Trinickia dabaoshanensis TaxID=564714 RepID=A0A2N7W2J9_9BURK|nr:MFS transporter [Trinickia dabaoshanensis]PMS23631.1 MFS transporter [Trinickia dabaoshanensis]